MKRRAMKISERQRQLTTVTSFNHIANKNKVFIHQLKVYMGCSKCF